MNVRCLIVDDEPLAIQLIQNHLSQLDSFEVVATCNTAMKAFEILNTKTIDLLFLDIKMPGMTGIEFLRSLKTPPSTIFTTAYRNYAIESYDLDVIDYLLKPITFDRFFRAIERYTRQQQTPQAAIQQSSSNKHIIIKSGSKHHKITINNILYIESLKDYIQIYTAGKRIVAKSKISDIEHQLVPQSFLRVHRSFIVNLRQVTAFTTYDIEIGDIEIPIGASYKEKILPLLKTTL